MIETPVELGTERLKELLLIREHTTLDGLKRSDPDTYAIVEALGRFFAVNPDLADYAVDVEMITLVDLGEPGNRNKPVRAVVRITHGQRLYTLTTAGNGALPIPWRRRGSGRGRRRWWR